MAHCFFLCCFAGYRPAFFVCDCVCVTGVIYTEYRPWEGQNLKKTGIYIPPGFFGIMGLPAPNYFKMSGRSTDNAKGGKSMWYFTKHGFYSVVCAREDDGRGGNLDHGKLMIRARARQHLENLVSGFPDLADATILENVGTDYPVRIVCERERWEKVAKRLAEEIDYGNFKDELTATHPEDDEYRFAASRVWGEMLEFQWDVLERKQNETYIR